ncbi:accessory Sec system glycosylation chaperone GtfB [Mammaliicoccus sp. G-M28]|uniref:accessory Sec system glycosylation chaperone GtfB n=1 Tax=Mammaliicoccus sp. G-M28 TaxID=2898688 RepID=UPI001EFACD9C|nr:accessory Sec system glycosylation chaperone GtfB [Mammaliicoccus sp. G-M28]
MINLFESFNTKTKVLYKTFKNVDMDNVTIVIEEDGFLPSNILTPYQFFACNQNQSSEALFFNQVNVPQFWEIEGNNNSAEIKDMGETKGRIIYKNNFGFRIVERIEWLNKYSKTQVIDYYNKNGLKYAQLIVDDNQRRIIKRWFNDQNQEIITENFITNDIILKWQEKEYIFHSKVQFIIFYLKVANMPMDSFLINSLSIPCAVLHDLKVEGNDYLFWQEKANGNLPGNMKLMLSKKLRGCHVIAPSKNEFNNLIELVDEEHKNQILELGYVYDFVSQNQHSHNVLTLTNSDQIPNLEDLVNSLPQYQFHIVALTEMSQKLTKLNSNDNVTLFPNAPKDKIISLYNKCDIYLDINKGNEILDAVKAAFDYQLLILGYKETLHNENYVATENQISLEKYHDLVEVLRELDNNESVINDRLNRQLEHAGSIDKATFKEGFK